MLNCIGSRIRVPEEKSRQKKVEKTNEEETVGGEEDG